MSQPMTFHEAHELLTHILQFHSPLRYLVDLSRLRLTYSAPATRAVNWAAPSTPAPPAR